MNIFAFANQKGGTGKTTTVWNIGDQLAAAGYRVLMVDCDPQATLTTLANVGDEEISVTIADVLSTDYGVYDAVAGCPFELPAGQDLLPSEPYLAQCELNLQMAYGREYRLKRALAEVAGDYDYCLIDCPPSLGLLVINALAAATNLYVVARPQFADVRATRLFLRTVAVIAGEINPNIEITGIIANELDMRLIDHREAIGELRTMWPNVLTVGRATAISRSSRLSQPLQHFDKDHRCNSDYLAIAKQITEK